MVRFPITLDQFTAPFLHQLLANLTRPRLDREGEAFSPILRDENYIELKAVNTVIERLKGLLLGHNQDIVPIVSPVTRKVTYRLYPTALQQAKLADMRGAHQRLYNAALEERITAYHRCGVSVGYVQQCKELTQLRAEDGMYASLNAQSCQVTLKRLHLAFGAFFRRVKAGAKEPGFPRFKSYDRYPGWGYKTHGDGWRLLTGEQRQHGKLRLAGVGTMKLRGRARTSGTPKTCEIQYKAGRWYASVTITCKPQRERGALACGIDWGVETYATIARSDGTFEHIENPCLLKQSAAKLKTAQQDLSRKKRGSKNRQKSKNNVVRLHQKIANQRKNFLHQLTALLVGTYAAICTEQLNIAGMTANGGAYKTGLNKAILDTSPGFFLQTLSTKAVEASCWYEELNTRKEKPSQTCHACGKQEKKLLSERRHECDCGASCSRDENSALVCLQYLFRQELSGCPESIALAQETPSYAA